MLLTTPPSYRAQIVKVAAEEAGLKWKPYLVDIHKNMDQYKTWYLKLNPGAYVPTMLIRGNIPICESIDIIEYMDNKLDGQNKLMSNQTDLIKERYQKVKELHEAFDVEAYTFGSI